MLFATLAFLCLAPSTAAFAPGLKLRAQFSNARHESQSIARRLGNVAADLLLSGPAPPSAASQHAVARAYNSAPSARKTRALQSPAPKQANLTPVQKASVDQWFQQYQRTRDIGVGYYNNVAAVGDARVAARAPVMVTHPGDATSQQPIQHDVPPPPTTYHAPAPVQQPVAQARTAPADDWKPATRRLAARQPVHRQPVTPTMRQDAPSVPSVRQEVMQHRASGTKRLLDQGLAGAALRAKQQNELEAFRQSFQKNRFPTSRV